MMGSNKSLVGKKYPPEMRTITSDMIGNYASATADANPLYLKSDVDFVFKDTRDVSFPALEVKF